MKRGIGRRDFLKRAGLAAGAAGVVPAQAGRRVAIRVADGHPPHVHWAAEELRRALAEHGVTATGDTSAADLRVVAEPIPQIPAAPPESLTFAPTTAGGRRTILASGSDARGVMYALLELADRARYAADPIATLANLRPVTEHLRRANAEPTSVTSEAGKPYSAVGSGGA